MGLLIAELNRQLARVKSFTLSFSSGLNPSLKMLSRLATKAVAPFGRSLLHTTAVPRGYVEPWDDPERDFVNMPKAAPPSGPAPPGKPDAYLDPWENPERDYINYPTRRQLETNPPVRHIIWPEAWFKNFHPKTGVTGPYAFGAGVLTYLWSKEIWVMEHDFLAGIEFYMCVGIILKMIGPSLTASLDAKADADNAAIDQIQKDEMAKYKVAIEEQKEAQVMASSYEELIQAKKEAVGLQLEAEYRSRLQNAYSQVKQRLDYQLELTNVMRRVEQKHMVDWIISNVRKSITAKQEDDALKKCVADLKALAK